MAKRRGILLAGLAAGAYAYFKKPENREKATVAFNNAKTKVNSFMESQNLDKLNKTDAKDSAQEKETVNDSGEPGVQYYNEDKQADENAKLSSNDTSEEKSENTKTVSPEPRIGTNDI